MLRVRKSSWGAGRGDGGGVGRGEGEDRHLLQRRREEGGMGVEGEGENRNGKLSFIPWTVWRTKNNLLGSDKHNNYPMKSIKHKDKTNATARSGESSTRRAEPRL